MSDNSIVFDHDTEILIRCPQGKDAETSLIAALHRVMEVMGAKVSPAGRLRASEWLNNRMAEDLSNRLRPHE